MASVKRDQIIQEAEKLAARGKLDAAIKEYRRAADQAPNDTNTLNRLGDLLQRVGKVAEAIEVYQRIAEHFAQDGFFLKSIAIFKKVNRLDPQRTETYERLADLYFKQGLAVEGRQQLLTLADWFLRSKQPDGAVRVFRRLVEFEPNNFQARAKLVDLLVQLGDVAAVNAEIDALGHSLLSRGLLDEAIKLYHRALDLAPEQVDFVAPCVDALVAANRLPQAVELARKAIATSKPGVELRRAAARAWVESGDLRSARKLLEELLPQTGQRTDILQLYGDVMLRVGEPDEAKDILFPVVDRLLKAGDVARAGALIKKLLLNSPADPAVLERAVSVFDRKADPDMVHNIETALADAYFRGGRSAEAVQLYQRLALDHPDNALFARRLKELGATRPAPAPAPPLDGVELSAASPDAAARVGDQEIEFVDVEFVAEPTIEAPVPAPVPAREEGVPAISPQAEAKAALSPTNAEELYTEAMVFVKYGLTDKAIGHLHRLLSLDPTHVLGRDLLRSLGGGEMVEVQFADVAPAPSDAGDVVEPSSGAPVPGEELPAAESPQFPEFNAGVPVPFVVPPASAAGTQPLAPISFESATDQPAAARPARPPHAPLDAPLIELASEPPPVAPAPRTPPPAIPLPDLDALVAKEKPRFAVPRAPRPGARPVRLDDLEAALGLGSSSGASPRRAPKPTPPPAMEFDLSALGLPDSAGRPAVHVPAPPPAPPSAASVPDQAPALPNAPGEEPAPVELLDVPELLTGPSEDQLRELDFFIQQGLLDDAAKLLGKVREAFGDHPDVISRHALLKARGWDEERPPAQAASAADLFSEEEHFFDLAAELEKELAEDELVAEATGAGKSEDVSIEELFKEFQRGVAEQVEPEDFDTHFNLGLAYREMGLLDEAIGEFQLSTKSADFLVESASMIGACYIDKGLPEQAAEWYGRALGAPNVPSDVQVGLRYELGRAHELAGNISGALASYAEVIALNPSHRDVVDRVSRLKTN